MGFSIDSILEVEMVTADGQIVTANQNENADLFWGVRGAANNFGIVWRIVARVQKLPETIYGGEIIQAIRNPKEYFMRWSKLVQNNDFSSFLLWANPPHFPGPHGLSGNLCLHFGSKEKAESDVQSLVELGEILPGSSFSHQRYSEIQKVVWLFFLRK